MLCQSAATHLSDSCQCNTDQSSIQDKKASNNSSPQNCSRLTKSSKYNRLWRYIFQVSTSIFAGDKLRNTSTRKFIFYFFIDLPISDELVALPFGFSLFQFPKIRNNAIINQPISDEFGTVPIFPKMNPIYLGRQLLHKHRKNSLL